LMHGLASNVGDRNWRLHNTVIPETDKEQ